MMRIAKVPYKKLPLKKRTYERPRTRPGIASVSMAHKCSGFEIFERVLTVKYAGDTVSLSGTANLSFEGEVEI